MANEAVLVNDLGVPCIDFTCANAQDIKKGTIMSGQDARGTISGVNVLDGVVGIASADKEASDGAREIALWTAGIFNCYCGGTITTGDWVVLSGANIVSGAGTTPKTAKCFGKALEDGSQNETIEVMLSIPG